MNYRKLMKQEDIERFEKFVPLKLDSAGHCLWKGACNQNGYPVFWWDSSIHVATRVIYSLHHNVDIPERDENGNRVVVSTTCGKRNCVHVEHLKLTTYNKSVSDAHKEGHYEHVHESLTGSRCHFSKLSEGAVRRIKELVAEGKLTNVEIAKMYGVAPSTIGDVLNGVTWRHVE